jgi:DNA-binding NarL/FixJ family response regulator
MTVPVRILVADDHAAVRRGVINILTSARSLVVCGEARNGDEAIQKTRELQPDLILLDISMPDINGLEVARRIREEFADARILIMTQYDARRMLPSVRAVGALACVDKSRLSKDLLRAIESVAT